MKAYKNEEGKLHRVNGPALVWDNGDYVWYYTNQRHRYYGSARCWCGDVQYWIFDEKVI